MAVLEGYAEHVMDVVGKPLIPSLPSLREAMTRRRATQSPIARLFARLLGLDLKMRQYELGKRFCDAVVEEGGVAALNRVWEAPELLPDLKELEGPSGWIDRTHVQSVTRSQA
jgi:putative hydrolase